MKKILLLLVSGMFILSLAGSAVAEVDPIGIQFPDLEIEDGYRTMYIPADGAAASTAMVLYIALPGNYDVNVTTDSADLEARVLNLDGAVASGDPVWGSLFTPSLKSYTFEQETSYPCYLWVRGGTEGFIYIDVAGTSDNTVPEKIQVHVRTTVPEFPTVALPVAAILGLVFIFGRRKEGL